MPETASHSSCSLPVPSASRRKPQTFEQIPRAATIDDWREFLGVTSRHHTESFNLQFTIAAEDHIVFTGFKADWVTQADAILVMDKIRPHTIALATAVSPEDRTEYPLVWASEYGGAPRV